MKSHLTEQELLKLYRGFFVFGDPASLKILYLLERAGTKTFTQLKTELSLNPTTLSRRLKLLMQVGLITSESEAGKLNVYYTISAHRKQLKRFLDCPILFNAIIS